MEGGQGAPLIPNNSASSRAIVGADPARVTKEWELRSDLLITGAPRHVQLVRRLAEITLAHDVVTLEHAARLVSRHLHRDALRRAGAHEVPHRRAPEVVKAVACQSSAAKTPTPADYVTDMDQAPAVREVRALFRHDDAGEHARAGRQACQTRIDERSRSHRGRVESVIRAPHS